MHHTPDAVSAVLDFWFGPAAAPDRDRPRREWFRKDPAFDAQIRERFGNLVDAALEGGLGDWETTSEGTLALILLVDQFTRNIYRGTAGAFAGDARAQELARGLLDRGWDRELPPLQRGFAYLPFEHSEDLADQDRSVALFTALAEESGMREPLDWAIRHRNVIARFGRFPHRNAALGRRSTTDEEGFLREPGSSF